MAPDQSTDRDDDSCDLLGDEIAREKWMHRILMQAMSRNRPQRRPFIEAACGDRSEYLNTLISRLAEAESFETGPGDPEFEEPPRTHVGPYRIERELGRGGMGVVYLATREDDFQMRVAVKLVKPGLDSDRLLRAFHQERQILATLQHPCIAQLHDGGTTEDGRPYLVMEYVDGTPLSTYCREARLDLNDSLKLFGKICRAVSFAHQKLIIHRDLKSSNVMITRDGEPKLLDFGIAAFLDAQTRAPVVKTFDEKGRMTPEYASPEQVSGERLTAATDVYSLGVILYEMLTGCLPFRFKTTNPNEWQEKICTVNPIKPSLMLKRKRAEPTSDRWGWLPTWRRIPADLDAITAKAMAKSTEERYGSAEQLTRDLKRFQQNQVVSARKAGFGYVLQRFLKRNRMQIAIMLLVSGLALTALQQRAEAIRERDIAELERKATMNVTEFLNRMFRDADPKLNRDKPLTVLEMLDRGIARIETDMRDYPWIGARLYFGMGETYLGFGHIQRAEELFARGLELRESLDRDPDRLLFHLKRQLAVALRENGKEDEALDMLQRADETRKRLPVYHKKDEARWNTEYGQTLVSMGWFPEAEIAFHRAIELMEGLPEHNMQRGAAYNGLSRIAYNANDFLNQKGFMELALDNFCQIHDSNPLVYYTLLTNHGNMLILQGQIREAEEQYRQAWRHFQSQTGDHPHFSKIAVCEGLSGILLLRDQMAEAETYIEREQSMVDQLFGNQDHIMRVYPLTRRAMLAMWRGEFDIALSLFERAQNLDPSGDYTEHTRLALAECQLRRGQASLAKEILNEMPEGPNTGDPNAALYLRLAGRVAYHLADFEEARRLQEQARDLMERFGMWEQVWGAFLRVDLAATAIALDRPGEANALLANAERMLRRFFDGDHEVFLRILSHRGAIDAAAGRIADAREKFQVAERGFRTKTAFHDNDLYLVLRRLADLESERAGEITGSPSVR
ncbi:Non-specific serine/threonine protein kinase [Sulfidibacter corallicola]|uniref:Protein kinase n=1 Tax=Sulfidibacter corallicola TaxID=2818388 RepID=A0A8A4TS56_SULCO|nr:serine/threonine-protein kinase [Sulfidibacter corallicola]QTD51861.1 protein kinase [Sulfidibacter corallicola]